MANAQSNRIKNRETGEDGLGGKEPVGEILDESYNALMSYIENPRTSSPQRTLSSTRSGKLTTFRVIDTQRNGGLINQMASNNNNPTAGSRYKSIEREKKSGNASKVH